MSRQLTLPDSLKADSAQTNLYQIQFMPLVWIAILERRFAKRLYLIGILFGGNLNSCLWFGSRYCLGVLRNASTRSGFRALCRQIVGALTIRSHRQTMLGLVAER